MNDFEKSIIELVDELFNITEKDHFEILRMYRQSRDNIKQFIAELFMKYGHDGKLDITELNKYNRLQKLEEQIKEELKQLAKSEAKTMSTILAGIVAVAYYKTAYNIEKTFGVGIKFNLLKKEFIDEIVNRNWSGTMFSERIWDNVNALAKSLKNELYRGIMEGESIDKIARRINKQFNSKSYQSQRLIRTEAARVISDAQEKIYKDSGLVQYVQYVATLDSRTSDTCRSRDGKRWRIDDPSKPKIPAHPNCRSTWIPVISDGYKNKKRKDNETKEIIEYKNYEEWAKAKGIK